MHPSERHHLTLAIIVAGLLMQVPVHLRASQDNSSSGRPAIPHLQLDELERHAARHIGQTISVEGEIQAVFGPRLFTIDEPNWIDFESELAVFSPDPLGALFRPGDRVVVTATVEPSSQSGATHALGWEIFGRRAGFEQEAILVAKQIVGGDSDRERYIDVAEWRQLIEQREVVNAPDAASPRVLRENPEAAIGRRVALRDTSVSARSTHGGFFVQLERQSIFVFPARLNGMLVAGGNTIDVDGFVLRAPAGVRRLPDAPDDLNTDLYVLSTHVEVSPNGER